ncbi:MAG: amino acid permease [Robiginitalea sp.]|uniref:amino acid permease n=1 Tax=Robiginitalea sp. TaxID=1902411 RepID=UPI003C787BA5
MAADSGKQALGIWMTTALVIGNMIGAGIFMMPAALAGFGGISILGWLVSAAGALVLARVFSALTKMVPNSHGGPYAFAKAGFGDYIGFLVAWGYWVSIWIANAAITIAFISAMSVFFPVFKTQSLIAVGASLATIWGLTWYNSLGVRSSGKMQVITTLLKLVPLVIIIIGGFFYFDAANFSPFNASDTTSLGAIAATGTLTFYSFLGFESATVPSDKVRDPKKTIPRATLWGTLITTAVYILSTVVIMGMIPAKELSVSAAPFADAMQIMSGKFGAGFVAAGVAIASFGALNGWIFIQSQVAEATARDRLFPGIFRKENRHGVPIWGMAIGSTLSSLVVLMNYTDGLVEQFRFMILLSTFCVLVPYLFASAAFVVLSLENSQRNRSRAGIFTLGGLAFAFSLWAIYGAGESSVLWGFILLMLGTPVYVFLKWKNKSSQ